MDSTHNILIIDDEESLCKYLKIFLKKHFKNVEYALSSKLALQMIKKNNFDIVITDINMPEMDGLELLTEIKKIDIKIKVIIMTAYATKEAAIKAVNEGAFYFIEKPFENKDILNIIIKATNLINIEKNIKSENNNFESLAEENEDLSFIVGSSKKLMDVIKIVKKVAPTDSTVLINGESGTGKELIAKAIYLLSKRKDKPFISINCGALPETLLESELFGYKKGAFTGANKDKDGLFMAANKGTLFLDEIGNISLNIQIKLLRVLQEMEIIPVGATSPEKVSVRLIAATNVSLEDLIEKQQFRADLYYRLNTITIVLPPLRERKEDIPLLVDHFLKKISEKMDYKKKYVTEEYLQCLINYDWPGNIRELENILERSFILSENNEITIDTLPEKIVKNSLIKKENVNILFDKDIKKDLITEKELIISLLNKYDFQMDIIAKELHIDMSTLHRKIKKYEIRKKAVIENKSYDLLDSEEEKIIHALNKTDFNLQKAALLLGISENTLSKKIKIHKIKKIATSDD